VNNKSAQDRYVMGITVVSCLNHHASLGNCSAEAMNVELTTFRTVSHDAIHQVTKAVVPLFIKRRSCLFLSSLVVCCIVAVERENAKNR